MKGIKYSFIFILSFFIGINMYAQNSDKDDVIQKLNNQLETLNHRLDRLEKISDDILWYNKVGDIAYIDKVYIYGPPKWKEKNPTTMGAGNPVKFWTYTFIPKDIDPSKKYPLIVLPHGGVHADFTTYYAHMVRVKPMEKRSRAT